MPQTEQQERQRMREAVESHVRDLARLRSVSFREAAQIARNTYAENRDFSLEVKREHDYWNLLLLITDEVIASAS